MKRIILIHTVQCMYLTFEQRLREALNTEVKIDNILDTFFANNSNELGYFSQQNTDRLYLTLKSAELTGADIIAVICSTLTPHVEKIAPLIPVPIVPVDGRLGEAAISHGDRIMVLASASSAVDPTIRLIRQAETKAGRHVQIDSRYDLTAFHAMMRGDMKVHDAGILEMARSVHDKDAIVFAQGSMEHTAKEVEKVSGLPVITAPSLCIQQIKELVEG